MYRIFALIPASFLLIFLLWLYSAGVGLGGILLAGAAVLLFTRVLVGLFKRAWEAGPEAAQNECAACIAVLGFLLFIIKLACLGPECAAGAAVSFALELGIGFMVINQTSRVVAEPVESLAEKKKMEFYRHERHALVMRLMDMAGVCRSNGDWYRHEKTIRLALYLMDINQNGGGIEVGLMLKTHRLADLYITLKGQGLPVGVAGIEARLDVAEAELLEAYQRSCELKIERANAVVDSLEAALRREGLTDKGLFSEWE